MTGIIDPYFVLAATSSAVGAIVLLLFAFRRIPRLPAPDDINRLREDFYGLSEQFLEFVEKHDEDMGRYHAKVGSLRRKLRRLQEEEGEFDEDEEAAPEAAEAATVLIPPDRATQKRLARARLTELQAQQRAS